MTKKVQSSNRPRRIASAYIRFASDERKKEDQQGLEGQEKMGMAERSSRYSMKWASLPESEKSKYTDAYQKDMAEYKRAMEEYKKTNEYKDFLRDKSEEKRKQAVKGSKSKKPRNVSSYNVFMAEIHERKKKEGGFDFKEVVSLASSEWKEMSKQNKEVYQKKADEKNKARREKEEAML